MFSFFRKKAPAGSPDTPVTDPSPASAAVSGETADRTGPASWLSGFLPSGDAPEAAAEPVAPVSPVTVRSTTGALSSAPAIASLAAAAAPLAAAVEPDEADRPWLARLRTGLRKTGANLTRAFTGVQIDDALYEELETALLMADTGVAATEQLLAETKWRVREYRAETPDAVKRHLADALADLLQPLEAQLVIGDHAPTVLMVVGVNGAGKTTTIGKLTRHLAESGERVLLAAADTFRAAAKEQLAVWAGRNRVEIVSQAGGDPSAVAYDAVAAGAARGCGVVIADTAGRLPTQIHLMDELKKIKRTIGKAQGGAPHEVLLVVDGNTGQNALAQLQAFDDALGITGVVLTKLDGTARGGVLAAIALWGKERQNAWPVQPLVPVYFIGVGEQLEDLQPFQARTFADALLGLEPSHGADRRPATP